MCTITIVTDDLVKEKMKLWLLVSVIAIALRQNVLAQTEVDVDNSPNGGVEYCQLETFRASCPRDEVIVVTAANYGRMRIGRCIKEAYGHLSCAVNVLDQVDSWCSGRRTCEFPVAQLHGLQPCPTDLTPALEITYRCVALSLTVATLCDKTVQSIQGIMMTSSGYLGSIQTIENGKGSPICPWYLAGQLGQVINITLINFSRLPPKTDSSLADGMKKPRQCYQLAIIKDSGNSYPVTECDLATRKKHILVSKGASVEILILTKQQPDVNFLLFYQVLGCADVPLPTGTYASKSSLTTTMTMTVYCNNSAENWQLTCRNGRWLGNLGNCTTPAAMVSWTIADLFAKSTFPFNLLLIVSVGVALGVFLGGLLLVCISRRMRRQQMPGGPAYSPSVYSRSQSMRPENTTLADASDLSQYDYMFSCVTKTTDADSVTSCPQGTKLRSMTSRYAHPPQAPSSRLDRDVTVTMRVPMPLTSQSDLIDSMTMKSMKPMFDPMKPVFDP